MKVIELFAGIGSQTQALKNLGIAHEVIGISDSQLYKQAGNSIVVNVLEAIFKNLFLGVGNEKI